MFVLFKLPSLLQQSLMSKTKPQVSTHLLVPTPPLPLSMSSLPLLVLSLPVPLLDAVLLLCFRAAPLPAEPDPSDATLSAACSRHERDALLVLCKSWHVRASASHLINHSKVVEIYTLFSSGAQNRQIL